MRKLKIISIIPIITIILLSSSAAIYAVLNENLITNKAVTKINTGDYDPGNKIVGASQATEKGAKIATVVRVVATIIAVIGLLILGIRYMASSIEQRAEYKKSMIPYVIGCVMIFAIVTIVSIIYELSTNAIPVEGAGPGGGGGSTTMSTQYMSTQ